MRLIKSFLTGICLSLLVVVGSAAQQDVEGGRDHPLLTRMKNFYISGYQEFNYDSHEFYDEADNEYIIEGRKWEIEYTLKEGFEPPGQVKVRQNHINAVRKIGGEVLYEEGVTMKVVQGNRETWIDLWVSSDGADYRLTIVERTVMDQEVVADPDAMADDLKSQGHTSIYGIYFDVDSDVVKPESEPTLKAIAELLNKNTSLQVYIVGHTDMTGTLEHNMDLSQRRALSVVRILIEKYGIPSGRLTAKGVGPLSPVGTNRTEEGRKLNRRVELVEKLS